ncbi:hypothetical protein FE257_008170 [Aspergillus nanangensis]|uniref:Fatty acid desaturase domain-containing protein n=1 Tax=Aspergillus nanangensis TaxID=2582783 RepID=A0AAD4GTU9_ASPNN|nr:hypothetical protein FE257_008170 [Aspergillus nanangensis]
MAHPRSGPQATQRTQKFQIGLCRFERILATYLPERVYLRYKEFDWVNIIFLTGLPLVVCVGAFQTPLQLKTAIWMCLYDYFIALSLTDDPYNARKCLFHSHIGWLFLKYDGKCVGKINATDLNEDPVVIWQQRIYLPISLLTGIVFPSLVASLGWNDLPGGILYASCLRIVFRWHMTFCTNSLAHYMGEQPFDDRHSPRNHLFTALLTVGEGYHNFHHEFPNDYRNGIQWYDYDPTKWSIWIWKQLGWAYQLNQTQVNETEKSRLQQLQKHLDNKRATLLWGPKLNELPLIEWDT